MAAAWFYQRCRQAIICVVVWLFYGYCTTSYAGVDESIAYIKQLLAEGNRVAIFLIDMQERFQSEFVEYGNPKQVINEQEKIIAAVGGSEHIYVVDINYGERGRGPTINKLLRQALRSVNYQFWEKLSNSPFSGETKYNAWNYSVEGSSRAEDYTLIDKNLERMLKLSKVTHIFAMGCLDGACVRKTVKDALERGFQVAIDRSLNVILDRVYLQMFPGKAEEAIDHRILSGWRAMREKYPSLTIIQEEKNQACD